MRTNDRLPLRHPHNSSRVCAVKRPSTHALPHRAVSLDAGCGRMQLIFGHGEPFCQDIRKEARAHWKSLGVTTRPILSVIALTSPIAPLCRFSPVGNCTQSLLDYFWLRLPPIQVVTGVQLEIHWLVHCEAVLPTRRAAWCIGGSNNGPLTVCHSFGSAW